MTTTAQDVEKAYSEYLSHAEDAKKKAQDYLDSLMAEHLTTLSRVCHEAHASGVTIGELRWATKAYNNRTKWQPIWEAYTPAEKVDLRYNATNPAKNGREGKGWREVEPGVIEIIGTDLTLTGVDWLDKDFGTITWNGMDTDEGLEIWKAHARTAVDYLKTKAGEAND